MALERFVLRSAPHVLRHGRYELDIGQPTRNAARPSCPQMSGIPDTTCPLFSIHPSPCVNMQTMAPTSKPAKQPSV